MTSPMAERGGAGPTRHGRSARLLSRLRCGLQTRLSCTAGLSCKPSTSSSESSSNVARRRAVDSRADAASAGDRKRLRSRDRKSSSDDVIASADSGVGRSPDSAGCAISVPHISGRPNSGLPITGIPNCGLSTSGFSASGRETSDHATSGLATTCPTYDVIGDRRKRRHAQLPTVSESDVPEPEMVTWSRGHVTRNDVMQPPMTTRRRHRAAELRELQYSTCCSHFYGK